MGWFSLIILVAVCAFFYLVVTGRFSNAPQATKKANRIDIGLHESLPINANVFITYVDAEGVISERQISVNHYDGARYLSAFCLLKNEPRTFRIDRIKSCTDTDTGEVVEDVPSYFNEKYESQA